YPPPRRRQQTRAQTLSRRLRTRRLRNSSPIAAHAVAQQPTPMPTLPADLVQRVRLAAVRFLEEQTVVHGDVLPRSVLAEGFLFEGRRVPLLGPQGIFRPAVLPDMPISITTVPPKRGEPPPYDDQLRPDGLLS